MIVDPNPRWKTANGKGIFSMSKSLVRIATAGSVDDGKSTLIGRLLWETKSLYEDQILAVREASQRRGESDLNLALVTDGLRGERDQNITIDVAYRPFRTTNRRFILADSPGHAQYTRNMVTAASSADIVLVLCDAKRGLTEQSHRHLSIAALLKVPKVVLAINKMDLVDYEESKIQEFRDQLVGLSKTLELTDLQAFPISALRGDNVIERSSAMPWYGGPSLLEWLDTVKLTESDDHPACVAIQTVHPLPDHRRLFTGTLQGGQLSVGDPIRVGISDSLVKNLTVAGKPQLSAIAGDAVAIELADEVDVARGDWLVHPNFPHTYSRIATATVVWLQEEPLRIGMSYQLRQGPRVVTAQIDRIDSQLDILTGRSEASRTLALNDIGSVNLRLPSEIPLVTFDQSRELGSFILVSPSGATAAVGLISTIPTEAEESKTDEAPVIWLTGLSGAGKSTIAEALVPALRAHGIPAMHLDGDGLRTGLCSDLGFSPEDRQENIRRTAEVARLFCRAGTVTVCSLISPLRTHRYLARQIIGSSFREAYVKCDVSECIRRDPKGLYRRALDGSLPNFTGVSAPYESPEQPEYILDTELETAQSLVNRLVVDILNTIRSA